ncbi:MAG: class I SAM-dependent methyltransferase [Rhodobacteraceae bacterium]|nr:class I SAM-dependent methyltransferase [Paracoccaceae bacterium]
MSIRLSLALETGELVLPDTGMVSVLLPVPDTDLTALPKDRVQIVQPMRPHFDHFQHLGFECVAESDAPAAAVVLCIPRAKALARSLIFQACRRSTGIVVVDGVKTDGIDSFLREIRKRVAVQGPVSKAHGKIFWFNADAEAFADWQAAEIQHADGYVTAPGVFSADGIDPASALLAQSLQKKLGRHVADLGAGWGYLMAQLLADPKIESFDVVEADYTALACARQNLADPRIKFHWADALTWRPTWRVDTVVMNPPFHTGRAADPALGRGFIETAARVLTPSGALWMVANRHLPYEKALAERFAQVQEVAGDNRFKVIQATRPIRPTRTRH